MPNSPTDRAASFSNIARDMSTLSLLVHVGHSSATTPWTDLPLEASMTSILRPQLAPLAYVLVWRATTKSLSEWTVPHAPATPPWVNHVPKPPRTRLLDEVLSGVEAVEVVVCLAVVVSCLAVVVCFAVVVSCLAVVVSCLAVVVSSLAVVVVSLSVLDVGVALTVVSAWVVVTATVVCVTATWVDVAAGVDDSSSSPSSQSSPSSSSSLSLSSLPSSSSSQSSSSSSSLSVLVDLAAAALED